MNPMPSDGGIPATPLFVNGYLDLLMILAVASLAVIFGMILWNAWGASRHRERIFCPVRLRRAWVVFRLAPNGGPTDVIRCSIFGRRPITCGKLCAGRTRLARRKAKEDDRNAQAEPDRRAGLRSPLDDA